MRKTQLLRILALLSITACSATALANAEDLFVRKKFVDAREMAARSSSLNDFGILGWSQFMLDDRAGFVEDGRLRQVAWRLGQWVDQVLVSILRDEWLRSNVAEVAATEPKPL